MFRNSKPLFIEDSNVPVILSKLAPIDIGAVTIGPLVFSRGKISEVTRRHETIHWQQYIETFIVGFLLLYFGFYITSLLKGRRGRDAYMEIPFEKEAYENQNDKQYLENRKRYAWIRRIFKRG